MEKSLIYKGRRIVYLDSVDSTNNYAKKLASGDTDSNTAVIAAMQTAGKGRLGRNFVSPKGTGLYMSVIIKDKLTAENLSLLTPMAAVAVSRAVDSICNVKTKIKWVNDIILNGKKICGILTEGAIDQNGNVNYAVVGMGVNIASVKKIFPEDVLSFASSVMDETGKLFSIDDIAREILDNIDTLMKDFESGSFIDEYREKSCVIGCKVSVTKYSPERTGKAVDIEKNGGLKVIYPDGTSEILMSGEASVIKNSLKF